jgi:hypothetical protein
MRWTDIPRSPSPRVLRQFAALWLVFFGGLASWQGLGRGRIEIALTLAVLALGVGLLGLAWPQAVRPIFVGWMILAFPIGWTLSLILLGLVYFGLFLPLGLAFRLSGRDALLLRPRHRGTTYWSPRTAPVDVRRYFRQF